MLSIASYIKKIAGLGIKTPRGKKLLYIEIYIRYKFSIADFFKTLLVDGRRLV
jgi:hypothetical protein